MTKKEMIERWNSEPEWIDKRKEIQNALVSPTGQLKYVKSDLRGLKIAWEDMRSPWIKGKIFEEIDFSYVDFSHCRIERCIFRKCIFRYTILANITEDRCEFSDCVFYKGKMNGWIGLWGSLYKNVTFDQIKLSSIIMFYPDFENCQFINCNLRKTEFKGAILNHVEIIGIVSDVKFKGRYIMNDIPLPEYFDARRMYQLNPMVVDFSKAEITYCMFTDECDLTKVILPKDGKHYLMKNKTLVKEYVNMFCEHLKDKEKIYLDWILDIFLHLYPGNIMDILNYQDWYDSMLENGAKEDDAKIILDRLIKELKDKNYIV